jgi:dienelactone hydrolase
MMGNEGGTSDLRLALDGAEVGGLLTIPTGATAIVLFAHGSGSGRHSARNGMVAGVLQRVGLATLLIDLLTSEEEEADVRTGHLRFDIDFLAHRLVAATAWLRENPATASLAIGYFGASTGAAAALLAAAEDRNVFAIVSRGGRPDLAMDCLPKVRAPTLLIVGGADVPIIPLNQQAYEALACEKELVIVPGATHLFEEPGALEEVARIAADWFVSRIPGR